METASPTTVLGKRPREVADTQPPDASKLFQCGDCRKSYSRVDHLARHVRLHTKEKPYLCQICSKSFARADLLKRHVAGHEARGDQQQSTPAPNRQGRVSKACEACAELHIRCDEQKPCTRCRKKQTTCLYRSSAGPNDTEAVARDLLSLAGDSVHAAPGKPNLAASTHENDASHAPVQPEAQVDQLATPYMDAMQGFPPREPMIETPADPEHDDSQMLDPAFLEPSNSQFPAPGYETDGGYLHDFLQSIIGGDPFPRPSVQSAPGHISGTWTPRNVFDFGSNTNLELSDLDLNFLDDYNHQNPFVPYVATPETARSVPGSTPSEPPSALGTESLQKASTWRFRPVSQDTGLSDQQNLSLPNIDTSHRLPAYRRVTHGTLSYTMRDRLIALTISTSKGENIQRTLASFPSLELLDSLVQFYLTSKVSISNRMIHVPTLRLNHVRPELLAAMVVGGATLAPDTSLRKMGFALMEAIRLGVPAMIEENNTLIENVECIEALGICLSTGLWSGNSRKMEIAESFLQPYVTMCRRRGWFRRAAYEPIIPLASDQGTVLEEKWNEWARQESRKRLIFYFFEHDTRQSITVHTNPLISYAELGLPLPEPEVAWLAPSAEVWKQTYLSLAQHQQREPSLTDLLQNVELLGDGHGVFDEFIANQALLSAAWRLIWEYRQMSSISRGHSSSWSNSTLLLSSRLAELTKLLDCVRMSSQNSASMTLSIELLHMHLHISLEEMHLFAGAEGHSEARRVFPLLQDWAKSSGARQGIYHAAQIVAAARKLGTDCLCEFHVVALYQAGLALWSYGVISNAAVLETGESINGAASKRAESAAMLDEVDSGGAQKFVALNKGQAAIWSGVVEQGSTRSHVLLSDPGAVMGVLMTVFMGNGKAGGALSPLVENLLELMDGLRVAVIGPLT